MGNSIIKITMIKLIVLIALIAYSSAIPTATNTGGRIVGGHDTNITAHPYQVSFQYRGGHGCAGSIIGDRWILTAAHCITDVPVERITIRAGITDLGEEGEVLKIAQLYRHPKHKSRWVDYDIGLVELAEPIVFGPKVQPIDIVEDGFEPVNRSYATTIGWGFLQLGGEIPTILQEVEVQIVDRKECQRQHGIIPISDRMVCAGVPGSGKDACRGDSGGPLIGDGKVLGIVSWSIGCAHPKLSGVYSNVGNMRSFIKETSGI